MARGASFLRACRVLVAATFLATVVLAFLAAGDGHVRDTAGILVLVVIECAAAASLTERIRKQKAASAAR